MLIRSTQDFVEYVCEQAGLPGRISGKRMFGEYALYVDAKVVALICDNQVYVKPTDEGKRLLGSVTEAPPYPGAKLHFQISELLEDGKLLNELLIATAATLPPPKPKAPKASTSRPAAAAAKDAATGAKTRK